MLKVTPAGKTKIENKIQTYCTSEDDPDETRKDNGEVQEEAQEEVQEEAHVDVQEEAQEEVSLYLR